MKNMSNSAILPGTTFSFSGRPDGIGNRFEQLILLEAICREHRLTCEYLWHNKYEERSYGIFFKCRHVKVVDRAEPSFPLKTLEDFSTEHFQRDFVLSAAKGIQPFFDIAFEHPPVGVHLRATDRIGRAHPHNMKNKKELYRYMSEALFAINKKKPRQLFVCSESESIREIFINHLDPSIQIVEPSAPKSIPSEYIDFFALSLCREIWMVSRLSTFSISASILGNIPLKTFVDDPRVFKRYFALFDLQPILGVDLIKGITFRKLFNRLVRSFTIHRLPVV